jgi:universal stress protein A
MSLKKILVAVDDGPIAARAAELGIELAQALGGEVAFVHAIDVESPHLTDSGITEDQVTAWASRSNRELLEKFSQRASPKLTAPPLEFARIGKPAVEIVKAADEWGADLVVIGSHGREGISRVLLGSVAESVLRHAGRPVLVVRAKR